MKEKNLYRLTFLACYLAYIVQAMVNNFAPLLFVTFHTTYSIPLDQIALLISINFGTQLVMDLVSAWVVDRIGYRCASLIAHFTAAVGIAGLGIFPSVFPTPFVGLVCASMLYAIGGGVIEVVVSPMVEACPSPRKAATMSMLHSFYSWGQLVAVLLSSLFFAVFGIANWRILAFIWAALPLLNGIFFLFVPIVEPGADPEKEKTPIRSLLRTRLFWVFVLLMVCSGAAELSVCQWASAFLETTIGLDKAVGDLAGICLFSVLMGTSRMIYGFFSEKLPLFRFMLVSGLLCVLAYVAVSFSPSPVVVLIGLALCGFSVGIMWPGTYSIAAKEIPGGGTAMFALLALAGDLGCTSGPSLVGLVANAHGGNLSVGLAVTMAFPTLFCIGMLLLSRHRKS